MLPLRGEERTQPPLEGTHPTEAIHPFAMRSNELAFELPEDKQTQMWHLRETISGCVFKAVSKDRKLTNSFWNFYRPQP
jgi:hypothetical protein